MFIICAAKSLGPDLTRLDIEAPDLARAAQPGQFLMLRIDERGERIPLTLAEWDVEKGTVSIIFLAIGKTTLQLSRLRAGDAILDVAGPMGRHMDIDHVGKVVCVGGGVGVPALFPKAKAFKQVGNHLISILGARTAQLLVLEQEMGELSDELCITTDDGSKGRKGFVSDELLEILNTPQQSVDLVMAVGPIPMMAAIAETTRPFNVKTLVSLNPIMVDGTGMCGGCRVTVGGETKYACVDGPVFDAHLVDFKELAQRQKRFLDIECQAKEKYEHACQLDKA